LFHIGLILHCHLLNRTLSGLQSQHQYYKPFVIKLQSQSQQRFCHASWSNHPPFGRFYLNRLFTGFYATGVRFKNSQNQASIQHEIAALSVLFILRRTGWFILRRSMMFNLSGFYTGFNLTVFITILNSYYLL